jgi:hypothetical protein
LAIPFSVRTLSIKNNKIMRYKDLLLQKVEQLDIMINNLNLLAREGQINDGHFDQLKDQIEEIRYQISLENED